MIERMKGAGQHAVSGARETLGETQLRRHLDCGYGQLGAPAVSSATAAKSPQAALLMRSDRILQREQALTVACRQVEGASAPPQVTARRVTLTLKLLKAPTIKQACVTRSDFAAGALVASAGVAVTPAERCLWRARFGRPSYELFPEKGGKSS